MKVGFHPVFDNPVRMGYAPGWSNVRDLLDRIGDLEHAVGERRVVPAPWEPFYAECPCCRHAGAYVWARTQLEDPCCLPTALALFPGEGDQLTTRIGHANWLILRSGSEPSQVTRELMQAEALELWETSATDWLERIVETCRSFGVETSADQLHRQVRLALQPLTMPAPPEEDPRVRTPAGPGLKISHSFDRDLLQLDGWTPDPGRIILPVDGRVCFRAREILLLDLYQVVLLRARRSVRSVAWDKITLVDGVDGAVAFEVLDEPPLVVVGYRDPEGVLRIVQDCCRAATERILQAVARQVTRPVP